MLNTSTHSSILAWKIPWMEEPGRLQSMGSLSQTWLSDFTFTFHFHALEKEMATPSSVVAWRIPGTGEPGGLPSMGSHRVRQDWSDLAIEIAMKQQSGDVAQWYSACFVCMRPWVWSLASPCGSVWTSLVAQMVKNLLAMQETWVS